MASFDRNKNSIIEESWQSLASHIYRVADKVCDYYTGNEKQELLEQCRQTMTSCLEMEEEYKYKLNLVAKTDEVLVANPSSERTVKEVYSEMQEQHKFHNKDPKKHDNYKNLLSVIKEAEARVAANGGASTSGTAAMDSNAPATEAAAEHEDEDMDTETMDLQMTDMQVNTIDPITKQEMKDPVMSNKCKHTFERTSIMALLKDKTRVRCPTPGCGWITANDLVPDMDMKRIIDERQTKRRV